MFQNRLSILAFLGIQILMYSCIPEKDFRISSKSYRWNKYVIENGVPINLDVNNESDLLFLGKYVNDKSIVMLGEQPHNKPEINLVKKKLVKFLHRNLNFDVIAFEMSMDYCGIKNFSKDSLDFNGFSKGLGMWNTKENGDLAGYIQKNMDLAGIDLTPASLFKSEKYLNRLFWSIDSNMAKYNDYVDYNSNKLYQGFIENTKLISGKGIVPSYKFNDQDSSEIFREKASHIITSIDSITDFYYNNRLRFDLSDDERLFTEQVIANRKKFISYLLQEHNWACRDSSMGQNLKWLKEVLYPDRKIIVWAANSHIEKNGILTNQLSSTCKNKSYHIAICPLTDSSKDLLGNDALFIDFSKANQLDFRPKYFNYYKKGFDAVILVRKR